MSGFSKMPRITGELEIKMDDIETPKCGYLVGEESFHLQVEAMNIEKDAESNAFDAKWVDVEVIC